MANVLKNWCAKVCPGCKTSAAGDCGCTYTVFRVLVGLMFMQHGAQKLLGMFGGVDGAGGSVEIMSLMGLAGLVELIGGLGITLGVFTRLIATIAAIEMAFAFFMAHAQNGWVPILNGGELVILFFAAFVLMSKLGNGKVSLEHMIAKKEVF